jgi:hypothetical protein
VVEHSIGNGEVDSSILSGSTTSRRNISSLDHTRRTKTTHPAVETTHFQIIPASSGLPRRVVLSIKNSSIM